MNAVKVKFKNPSYDYVTSVSDSVTEADARKYFVGNWFDLGIFPKEDFQKCIDIEFSKSVISPTPERKKSHREGGSLDEVRDIMKQDYQSFVKLLGENIKDEKFRATIKRLADTAPIKYRNIAVRCESLLPTQNEISLEKSLAHPLTSSYDAERYLAAETPIRIKNRTIITCDNGKYIIDGHHRWSQVYVLNPKAKIDCTDFYELKNPISGLKATQLGVSADLGYVPTKQVKDTNLLTISEKELKEYVNENITPDVVAVFKKHGISNPDEHIWKNVLQLKTRNKPIENASKKDIMPQTDLSDNYSKFTPDVSGTIYPYSYEKGGMVKNWQVKRDLDDRFYSIDPKTGKPKWNDSPDMGYLYDSVEEAQGVIKFLGGSGMSVVPYDKDWWKKMQMGGNTGRAGKMYEVEFRWNKKSEDEYDSRKVNIIASSLQDAVQKATERYAKYYDGFEIVEAETEEKYAKGGNIERWLVWQDGREDDFQWSIIVNGVRIQGVLTIKKFSPSYDTPPKVTISDFDYVASSEKVKEIWKKHKDQLLDFVVAEIGRQHVYSLGQKFAKGGGVAVLPQATRSEIEESIKLGYNRLVVGMIAPNRKGVALINENYLVRGVYPLKYKDAILSIKGVVSNYAKGGKTKLSPSQKEYNKDVDAYKWFVVDLSNKKAVSGWEFKNDAQEALSDYDGDKNYKVYSERMLKTLGIENPKDTWKSAPEEPTFVDYKGKEIMYSPVFKEYYVDDEVFRTISEAKKYVDDGAPASESKISAYKKGMFAKGGKTVDLSGRVKNINTDAFNRKIKKELKAIRAEVVYDNYMGEEIDRRINHTVAWKYIRYIADKLNFRQEEMDFRNSQKEPKNHFQLVMETSDKKTDVPYVIHSAFVYVDDNHQVVKEQSNVTILDDNYDDVISIHKSEPLYSGGGKTGSKAYMSSDELRAKLDAMSDEELLEYYVNEKGYDIDDNDHRERIEDERDEVIDELVEGYEKNMKGTGRFYAKGGSVKKGMQVELSSAINPDDYQRGVERKPIKAKLKSVGSFEEASMVVNQFISDNDLGAGNWTGGAVYKDGKQVAYVSYNGRVWSGTGDLGSKSKLICESKRDEMAKGGTTKKTSFEDKVQAIKSKLLRNKKVPKAVQKDYGKTFSPAEAEDSAKRIAGAMRKKELAGKYENGGSSDLSTGKNFYAIGKSKTKALRFGTHSYLLSVDYSHPRLVKGKQLKYGFLNKYTGAKGSPKGWFVADVSMDKEDFDKHWNLQDIFVLNAKTDRIKTA